MTQPLTPTTHHHQPQDCTHSSLVLRGGQPEMVKSLPHVAGHSMAAYIAISCVLVCSS